MLEYLSWPTSSSVPLAKECVSHGLRFKESLSHGLRAPNLSPTLSKIMGSRFLKLCCFAGVYGDPGDSKESTLLGPCRLCTSWRGFWRLFLLFILVRLLAFSFAPAFCLGSLFLSLEELYRSLNFSSDQLIVQGACAIVLIVVLWHDQFELPNWKSKRPDRQNILFL